MALKEKNKKVTKKKTKKNTKVAGKVIPIKPGQPFAARNVDSDDNPYSALDDGLNEKQIYDYLKNKYGDWILYDPGFNKNTYFLWLLPILMFVFGGAIILRKVILKKKKL